MADATAPRRASSSAMPPPIELPATCGRPRPCSANQRSRCAVKPAAVGSKSSGGDAPKPGRSTAITRRSRASASATGSHMPRRLPMPCRSTSGGPEPRLSKASAMVGAQRTRPERAAPVWTTRRLLPRGEFARYVVQSDQCRDGLEKREHGDDRNRDAERPAGARPAPPVAALQPDGRLRRGPRDPHHRPRRGLLRLGRPRQEVPRRAQRPVLRQHRPRPPRRRPGRRRPGARAGLLHQLVLRAPARDRAGGADRLARARATSTASSSPAAARRRSRPR